MSLEVQYLNLGQAVVDLWETALVSVCPDYANAWGVVARAKRMRAEQMVTVRYSSSFYKEIHDSLISKGIHLIDSLSHDLHLPARIAA